MSTRATKGEVALVVLDAVMTHSGVIDPARVFEAPAELLGGGLEARAIAGVVQHGGAVVEREVRVTLEDGVDDLAGRLLQEDPAPGPVLRAYHGRREHGAVEHPLRPLRLGEPGPGAPSRSPPWFGGVFRLDRRPKAEDPTALLDGARCSGERALMLRPAEVRPFLSHEDGFVRALALAYLSNAHNSGPATQEDLWAAMDRYGEAPKERKQERRSLALHLRDFSPTERSIERLFRGLRIEADGIVTLYLARAAAELPPEAVRRLLDDDHLVRRLPAEVIEGLREDVEMAGKTADALSAELEEQTARLRGATRIRPVGGREMTASPLFLRAERVVRAFARHPEQATERGLQVLRGPRHADRAWDEALALLIFTRVRLPALEERILEVVDENEMHFAVVCAHGALVRLGTPAVVQALAERFAGRTERLCNAATDVLKRIKHPESEAVVLRLFDQAQDPELRTQMALALCELCTTLPNALEAMAAMVRAGPRSDALADVGECLSALRTMGGLVPPDRPALKVFLDDERAAPEGWTHARWPEEVIALLETGEVDAISLDHDLGDDARTGYDVLTWIEEAVVTHGFTPPQIAIHTANAAARSRMELAVASIRRLARVTGEGPASAPEQQR
jgi:hypothetical protein